MNSLYIPRLRNIVTAKYIQDVFTCQNIGTILRVDWVPIHKNRGFSEPNVHVPDYWSAFVYVDTTTSTNVQFWNTFRNTDGQYRLHFTDGSYWLCLNNKRPIQETEMNIHQVVDNCRYLEERLNASIAHTAELEKRIVDMEEYIMKNIVK